MTSKQREQRLVKLTLSEMASLPQDAVVYEGVGSPKKGERFRCEKCGMEVQVTADCRCQQPSTVHFHCCGEELHKV